MAVASIGAEPTPFFRMVHTQTEFSYAIFASQPIIDEVNAIPQERRHFYLDGTFKVVPYGDFNQLLVVHAEFYGKVIAWHLFVFKNCIV